MDIMSVFLYVYAFLIGICIFSFLNVVIYRLPNKISLYEKRSFCPTCKVQIKNRDLIPIFSWIFLGGRCRNCKEKISVRYPIVEMLGGILAVFLFWNYCKEITLFSVLQATVVFIALSILFCVAIIDIDTMEIPDELQIALIIPAIAAIFLFPSVTIGARIIGFFVVSVPMLILALIIPGAFGGGDIKLMAVCGFFLGWKMCLVALFIGILIGGTQGIFLLVSGKIKKGGHFAFGPALCIGIAITVFWGEALLNWYLTSFFS